MTLASALLPARFTRRPRLDCIVATSSDHIGGLAAVCRSCRRDVDRPDVPSENAEMERLEGHAGAASATCAPRRVS